MAGKIMIAVGYEESFTDHPTLYETLRRVGAEFQPKSYCEVGVREGASLETLLSVCEPVRIVLCDTWQKEPYGGSGRGNHQHIKDLLDRLNYRWPVVFLDGRSQEVIPDYVDAIMQYKIFPQFDLILIDGDHSLEGAVKDWENCWPLLTHRGGIMIADDTTHKELHPYLDKAFRDFVAARPEGEYLYQVSDEKSGCAVARRN